MKPGALLIDGYNVDDKWTYVIYLGVIDVPDVPGDYSAFIYLLRDGTIRETQDLRNHGWYEARNTSN